MSATAVDLKNKIGFSGKVPSKGDFIFGGLNSEFIELWNEWLQSIIGVSREQLGEQWLDQYLISPVWNFSLSGGVCGSMPVSGVMIPSVDRVGRYFPFTLAAVESKTPIHSASENVEWFDSMTDLALDALDSQAFDVDELSQSLEELIIEQVESDQAEPSVAMSTNASGRKLCWQFTNGLDEDKVGALTQMLHKSWQKAFGAYALWWTAGSQNVPACMLVTQGLPDVARYAAMLDGQWDQWGWQSFEIVSQE